MDACQYAIVAAAMAASLALCPARAAWAETEAGTEASSNAYLQLAQRAASDADPEPSGSSPDSPSGPLPQTGDQPATSVLAAVAFADALIATFAIRSLSKHAAREEGRS